MFTRATTLVAVTERAPLSRKLSAIAESATLKVELNKPGTYEFYCPIDGHKQQGMKGQIKVAGGGFGSASEGATTDTSSGGSSSGY